MSYTLGDLAILKQQELLREAARHRLARTTEKELACDNEAMGQHDLVSILEVMGRTAGWIAAGAALGTCRYKLKKQQDFERVLEVFKAHNIRYFFYAGGNDSQDTADKISKLRRTGDGNRPGICDT